jgi:hypothetical protein
MNQTQHFTLVAAGLGLCMIFLDALISKVTLPGIQRHIAGGERACSGLWRFISAPEVNSA